jgi:transcriptional regulator with XRE-family HTH domain
MFPIMGFLMSNRDFTVDRKLQDRAERLRDAVRAAGGNKGVAERSGVPLSTLNSYLRGRDMPTSALIDLAEATHVRLEWLATGGGPRMRGEQPSAPPLPTPEQVTAAADNAVKTLLPENPTEEERAYLLLVSVEVKKFLDAKCPGHSPEQALILIANHFYVMRRSPGTPKEQFSRFLDDLWNSDFQVRS